MADPIPGPWTHSKKTKVHLDAFDFEITTAEESSHVPACDCHNAKESQTTLVEALQKGLLLVMQKLDEIRAAQAEPLD